MMSDGNAGFQLRPGQDLKRNGDGFSLAEILISLCILTFGLLAAAQIIFISVTSTTLSRSKGVAAFAAQSQLESLADLFSRNPEAEELTNGSHGPRVVEVANPGEGTVLNRFNVGWTVGAVPDPRPERVLNAKQVTVTVTPIDGLGTPRPRTPLNKVVGVSAIFSTRLP
jgi:type II secretory pathway pseudopilin PulG